MKKIFVFLILVLFSANLVLADDFDANAFFNEYAKEAQQAVKSNLSYKGETSASTTVTYNINADGSVSDIKLDKASGTDFDNAVIEAVQKSAPFKPFPKDCNVSYVTMTSGFQHIVQKYQSARMSIMPVEPSAQSQEAYKKYINKVSKYMFDRIPTTYSYIPQEPVIKCTILKDGTIRNFRLTQSSGISEYDKKIMDTFANIKVEPFPAELSNYDELPYSATLYKQFRSTPRLGSPNYMFR